MDKKNRIKLSSNIAVISGIFTFMVSILLLLNYWQIKSNAPLEGKSIDILVERLASEPNNEELKQEIRNLDLLARKAFFTSQWQINTGAHLLLFGSIILIVSLSVYYSLLAKIEKPTDTGINESLSRILSQRWVLGAGAFIIVLALGSSILSKDNLKLYSQKATVTAQPSEETEQIELIEIDESNELDNSSNDQITENTVEEISEKPPGQNDKETTKEILPKLSDMSTLRKNYNGFRGFLGNGISFHKNIPVDWDGSSNKNIKWKIPIPKTGHNSPIIWNEKLFIAGADTKSKQVFCYNRYTGQLIWQKEVNNIPGSPTTPPKTTDDTGLSAPTLTTDGKRVYAIFGTGDIIAFDLDGNRIWARNLGVPDNHYGHASSLITLGGRLFVQFDSNKGGKIFALKAPTGETDWEINRNSRISWASPILAQINNNYQLVVSGEPIVAGYEVETGKELWSVDCMSGEVGPSPAFYDGLVFAANEYATLAAIDPVTSKIVWEDNEYLPEVSSPVVSEGLLFIATSYGVLVCYDAKTGKKYWEQEFSQGFYSSPVIAENRLYAIDMDGVTHILELSKEPKIIGEPSLGEKVVTTPAFANNLLYIKGMKNLYCIGK